MTFVRKDIWTLEPDDPIITWYRYAVGAMKERDKDPTDPTSWAYQAAIHGIPQGHGSEPLWNQCQHEQWYFLPWHRMYCLRFEEIVRAVIVAGEGPEDWALPYWNYLLGGDDATLPHAFRERQADGKENPLYVKERASGMNSGDGEIHIKLELISITMNAPAFIGRSRFGGGDHEPSHHFAGKTGLVEQTPHNEVHGQIGGEFGWMNNPDLAAKDPIFWLHHANVDRLWERWKDTAGHDDPEESLWTGQGFQLFDAKADPVPLRCGAVQDTRALGYEYDPAAPRETFLAPPSPPPPPAQLAAAEKGEGVLHTKPHMVGATSKPIELTGEPVEVEIPIDAREAGELSADQHVYLNTENIEGERSPNTTYDIYVGGPAEAGGQLVGSLSFFGIERSGNPPGDANPHGLRFAAEITQIAQELAARDEWAGHRLQVSIEPRTLKARSPEHRDELEGPEHVDHPITIGRISVFYDAA